MTDDIDRRLKDCEAIIAKMDKQLELAVGNSIDVAVLTEKSAYIEEQIKTCRINIHAARNENVALQMRVSELEHRQSLLIRAAWSLFTAAQGILAAVTYYFK